MMNDHLVPIFILNPPPPNSPLLSSHISHSFRPLLILLVKIPHDHVTVIHSRLEDGKFKWGVRGNSPHPHQGRANY